MISIVVCYAHANPEFLELKCQLEKFMKNRKKEKPVELVYVQHNRFADRRRGFLEAKGDYILFLDADVLFPSMQSLEDLARLIETSPPTQQIWTGCYLTPDSGSFQLRAYNLICNRWLGAGDLTRFQPAQRILGGSFLAARRDLQILNRAFEARWGGEEYALVEQARQKDVTIYFHPALQVLHRNHRHSANFFRRAWTHGVSKQELKMSSTTQLKVRDWQNPAVIFWMVVHYSIVAAGTGATLAARARDFLLNTSSQPIVLWRKLNGSSKLKSNETLDI